LRCCLAHTPEPRWLGVSRWKAEIAGVWVGWEAREIVGVLGDRVCG